MAENIDRLTAALSDRYAIEHELGAGGMATVYLAQDLKHDRKVAVKVLRPELAAVVGAERFLPEIKLTANLQHPHILALHDSGEADGLVFYVMPFVEGESLSAYCTRRRSRSVTIRTKRSDSAMRGARVDRAVYFRIADGARTPIHAFRPRRSPTWWTRSCEPSGWN